MDACVHKLEQRNGRPAEETEIAAEMGVSLTEYQQLLTDTNCGYLLPFEEMVEEQGEPEDDSDGLQSPMARLLGEEHRERIKAAIEALPEREKLMITLYYQEELNLKEIGAVLGVSESRVCQLHSQAISRMRARLAD
jgi:RNA polymerase sigma factor for flagellar operon FliA